MPRSIIGAPTMPPANAPATGLRPGSLDAVRWIDLPSHTDARGTLTAIEFGMDVPFDVRRVYFVHGVRADRAGHAHRDTQQVLVAAAGRFTVVLSDGTSERTYVVDRIDRGLYICPMLFIRLTGFEPGTVMASFASTHYDKDRSIRSWPEYLAAIRS